jgi:ubiquinone/menaquinone biosynthesis C-methylase UbiE
MLTIGNRSQLERALEKMALQPDDRVLEIGFGSGAGIQLVAKQAAYVAGVEISETMLRQASRRNRQAIAAGTVELKTGSADRIPFDDEPFTHVFSINSIYFWPDVPAALAEIRRVLKGQLTLIDQPPVGENTEAALQQRATLIAGWLQDAGFTEIHTEVQHYKLAGWAALVTAQNR